MTIKVDLHFDTGVEAIVELPAVPRQDDEILWTDFPQGPATGHPYERTCLYRVTKVQWAISAGRDSDPCIAVHLEPASDMPS